MCIRDSPKKAIMLCTYIARFMIVSMIFIPFVIPRGIEIAVPILGRVSLQAVSYTHLDVYKRQRMGSHAQRAGINQQHPQGGANGSAFPYPAIMPFIRSGRGRLPGGQRQA